MLVNNKGNFSYEAAGVVLIPGTNKVGEKEFEKFLAHPLMAELDQRGEFVYEKGKTSAKDVIALVEDAYDVDMLEVMKAEEDRKTVLEAIDKRIAELKAE
ncbi:hypothetical protein D1953_07010 [Peribacillus asahii]|uniref:Uncharacterized protein n=1 Tax=Peribacillus asahii TaxID=228899 RepID=A0A398BHB3_9BACI|nr:hypothetical protein [Peribacillus asahii]RID87060.1 hypothetical protein D1953_07010 [Peribacillus asahii]